MNWKSAFLKKKSDIGAPTENCLEGWLQKVLPACQVPLKSPHSIPALLLPASPCVDVSSHHEYTCVDHLLKAFKLFEITCLDVGR